MFRNIIAAVGLAVLAGCAAQAPAAPPAPVIPQIVKRPPPPATFSSPARDEVLAFQNYGRQIADRVARDPAFGGFIFRIAPRPHAIVMFTGDAPARLRRYTSDPRFHARSVRWTLAQLESFKEQMGAQLSPLGLRCYGVDGDEEHNAVTISGPVAELEKVRAAIARGAISSPAPIRLVEQGCAVTR